jgi:hypothetical protein
VSLELWPADDDDLRRRLERLGLTGISRIALHQNRTVMVSIGRGRVLHLHRGYRHAPDRVLRAVVRFVHSRGRAASGRRARRELLAFPAASVVPAPPRPAPRQPPADLRAVAELRRRHAVLNLRHFGGRLGAIPIRLSGRMRTRLGELVLEDGSRRPGEIVISRRHLRRDGWDEVEHTLLHEMVHQWQAERGLPVDHGVTFRRQALAVGVEPRARRLVQSRRKAARYE